jgi:hypothetical protein
MSHTNYKKHAYKSLNVLVGYKEYFISNSFVYEVKIVKNLKFLFWKKCCHIFAIFLFLG